MAKDAKGHGSESRGGSDYAKDASGKMGYNPKVQGGLRMFGRQPTSAEKTANSQAVKNFSALAGAHSAGVAAVGQPPAAPKFGMKSYTHEIVSPTGDVAARMNLGKNSGLAVDYPAGARGSSGMSSISRSGGPSIHDAVSMPDYRATKSGGNSFPAEQIGGALHFLTGNDFAGHTVRRVKG